MKKLGKLTLKELKYEVSLISDKAQKEISGGGIDDNDCFFEALVCIGSWLGYNSQSYEGWLQCYGSTYGNGELFHAVTEGVTADSAFNFLQQNFGSVSYVSLSNFSGGGVTMGYLTAGSATHAVLISNVNGSSVTYYNPEEGSYNTANISQFAAAVKIN